jgi:yecA family protein
VRKQLRAARPGGPRSDVTATATLTPAYRHGFFTAVFSGPLVMPAEWLGHLIGQSPVAAMDELNHTMGGVIGEYNEVATLLLETPDDFVERVAALCGSDDGGQGIIDWERGYSDAIALRPAEWTSMIRDERTAELFAALSAVHDIAVDAEKRTWLADGELRRNCARALGISGVRVWELWRSREARSTEVLPPEERRGESARTRRLPAPRPAKSTVATSAVAKHPWTFRARLRARSFGWRSSRLAITRINEALREIRKVAKTDPPLAAEGAVLFLERVSPAFEHVDSSSGALGSAVNRAITELSRVIAAASVDRATREAWLERLWQACTDDGMGYLDTMEELWGDFCATPDVAARWVDDSISNVRSHFQRPRSERGYLTGSVACLSAMFTAKRYQDILDLLAFDESSFWSHREWGFRALAAQGRRAEALRYAEASNDINADHLIARACEELLLSSGLADEAYERYAYRALREETTYAGTFRSMHKRYPQKGAEVILRDLSARTPGREGKWFAAAKDAGLYDEAIALANASPCDPMTLARAARDFGEKLPQFAVEASVAAVRWIAEGFGYELRVLDVIMAYQSGLQAAQRLDRAGDFVARVKTIVAGGSPFVLDALRHDLGLPSAPRVVAARRTKPPRR